MIDYNGYQNLKTISERQYDMNMNEVHFIYQLEDCFPINDYYAQYGQREAEERYDECVKRHKNIAALDDRNITLAGNITYLFSDYPNVKEELNVYGSALI